jgi:hypothetical protein
VCVTHTRLFRRIVLAPAHDSNFGNIRDGVASYLKDADPDETQEWMASLDGLHRRGRPRPRPLPHAAHARALSARSRSSPCRHCCHRLRQHHPHRRTSLGSPATKTVEKRYRRWMRWNAAMLVHRAQRPGDRRRRPHLHLRLRRHPLRGRFQPLLPRQGPSGRRRPGLLPGPRLTGHVRPRLPRGPAVRGGQLDGFRQEKSQARARQGLPSYPHPHRLMPDFWEFPTVSMGLGPMNAIYQAQFNRYLHNRGYQGHLRPARLGVPRRRRDGRAGDPRRAPAGRERTSSTTSPSSSTATCSASTDRSAATARSSRSSRASSAVPAGTSSRSSGAANGTPAGQGPATARWSTS